LKGSIMSAFGHLVVCLTTVLSAAGGAFVLWGRDNPKFFDVGKKLLHTAAALSLVSLLVLVFLLLAHDYRVAYVRDYADQTMSTAYLFMAIWGGQEGSLLLWAALQAFFTSAVALWGGGRQGERLLPVALCFLASLQVFFFLLVLFHSNPFEPLGTIAVSGVGLNPLLRNPYMAIHPPTLYLGFVGFSVPMGFVFAALADGKVNDDWLPDLRPWLLFAWVFLSIGNILGMVWAYEELGWGGYWGWDPVENASFMPWLTGTALLHSVMVLERRKMFRLWSFVLITMTFVLIIFGTFLTRSGVIQSVHAFAGATAGPYLLGLIVVVIVLFVGLSIFRGKYLAASREIESKVSKETMFSFSNWAFVFSTIFVLLATMAPLLAEIVKGEKVATTPEFFNTWMAPLGLVILALIAVCANIGWRNPSLTSIRKKLLFPVAFGALASVIAASLGGVRSDSGGFAKYAPVIAVGLLGFVAFTVLRDMARLIANTNHGEGSKKAARRRLGGQMIHVSVVLLFVGFTGSAFTEEQSMAVAPRQTIKVGDYDLTFIGLREDLNFERQAIAADLEVKKGGQLIGVLSPARYRYHSHPGQPTSEVVIRSGLAEDLFLILGETDMARGMALIRVVINPLVIWIWIGGLLLVVGTVVALFPPGHLVRLFAPRTEGGRTLAGVTTFIAFAAVVGIVVGLAMNLVTAIIALAGIGLVGSLLLFGSALSRLATSEGK
jgi:cytochrome c-type biogenesis protein CcmF